jgi:hypothetical protein
MNILTSSVRLLPVEILKLVFLTPYNLIRTIKEKDKSLNVSTNEGAGNVNRFVWNYFLCPTTNGNINQIQIAGINISSDVKNKELH